MIQLPYSQGFDKSLQWCREFGFVWSMVVLTAVVFCFFICPLQSEIDATKYRMAEMEKGIREQQILHERKKGIRALVEERETLTMERLVREEFGVRRKNETGIKRPTFNMSDADKN